MSSRCLKLCRCGRLRSLYTQTRKQYELPLLDQECIIAHTYCWSRTVSHRNLNISSTCRLQLLVLWQNFQIFNVHRAGKQKAQQQLLDMDWSSAIASGALSALPPRSPRASLPRASTPLPAPLPALLEMQLLRKLPSQLLSRTS